MSKRLDETIGAVGFDNLINGQYPPAEVFTVKIRKAVSYTHLDVYKRQGSGRSQTGHILQCEGRRGINPDHKRRLEYRKQLLPRHAGTLVPTVP